LHDFGNALDFIRHVFSGLPQRGLRVLSVRRADVDCRGGTLSSLLSEEGVVNRILESWNRGGASEACDKIGVAEQELCADRNIALP
jgi:hypothetical protein